MNETTRNIEIWRVALSQLRSAPPFCDFVENLFDKAVADGVNNASLDSTLIIGIVTTPALCPLPEALRLARAASRLDNRLDSKILRHLTTPARNWPEERLILTSCTCWR